MAFVTLKVKVNSKTGRVVSVKRASKPRRTKAAIARSLYAKYPRATTEKLVKLFREKAGLTVNGARTYLYNIRRENAA